MTLKRWVGAGLLIVLAACRGDAQKEQTQAAVDTVPHVNQDSARQATTVKTAGGISGDTVGPGFKVVAEFQQDKLVMSPVEIPPGEVTILAQNKSNEVHRLEVVGITGGRWRTMRIQPGGMVSLNTTMVAGDYNARDPDKKDKAYAVKLVVK
jgi:hypothetical protein